MALCPIHTMCVGNSRRCGALALDGFPAPQLRWPADLKPRKISAATEPCRRMGIPMPRATSVPGCPFSAELDQDQIDQRDQGGSDPGGDQGVVGADGVDGIECGFA